MTAIAEEIRSFIQSRYPTATLNNSDDIFSLGYINSLFAMELVVFIESQFDIQIPNDDLLIDNFRSIAAMTDLVERQMSAQSNAG